VDFNRRVGQLSNGIRARIAQNQFTQPARNSKQAANTRARPL